MPAIHGTRTIKQPRTTNLSSISADGREHFLFLGRTIHPMPHFPLSHEPNSCVFVNAAFRKNVAGILFHDLRIFFHGFTERAITERAIGFKTGSYACFPLPWRTSNAPRNASWNCSTIFPSCNFDRSIRKGFSSSSWLWRAMDVHTRICIATAL